MKNGKVKINVRRLRLRDSSKLTPMVLRKLRDIGRNFQPHGQIRPQWVIRRKLGSFAKKHRFNPISRQLRWKREFIQALKNSVHQHTQLRYPVPFVNVETKSSQLDLNQGYSWTAKITTKIPFP